MTLTRLIYASYSGATRRRRELARRPLVAIGGALFFSELYGFLIRPPRLREDAIGLAALGLAMISAGVALWAG